MFLNNDLPAVVINACTFTDVKKPGKEAVRIDAAKRMLQYFRAQDYQGPIVLSVVDSSDTPNPVYLDAVRSGEFCQQKKLVYISLPNKQIPQLLTDHYPLAAQYLRSDDYFGSQEFRMQLALARSFIDPQVENPLKSRRYPLGTKRNVAVAVADAILKRDGKECDLIVYMDDDYYGDSYVSNRVKLHREHGCAFAAQMSYYVALVRLDPQADYQLDTLFGRYSDNETNVMWFDSTGNIAVNQNLIRSRLPFGFTYSVTKKMWDLVRGVTDITRGEDRMLFNRVMNYATMNGMDPSRIIHLSNDADDQLLRLLGDNSSTNAMFPMDHEHIPDILRQQVIPIFNVWAEAKKYELDTNGNSNGNNNGNTNTNTNGHSATTGGAAPPAGARFWHGFERGGM